MILDATRTPGSSSADNNLQMVFIGLRRAHSRAPAPCVLAASSDR